MKAFPGLIQPVLLCAHEDFLGAYCVPAAGLSPSVSTLSSFTLVTVL